MINTNLQEFRKAVEDFSGKRAGLWRKPGKPFVAWLQRQRIPAWLKRHLQDASLTRTTHVGVAYFFSPARIHKENEAYPEIRKHGFFQIGSAFDGDPLVVDFRADPGAVGYLSHDALWQDPDDREVLFLKVASSIGRYATTAGKIVGCPIDFYGTKPK